MELKYALVLVDCGMPYEAPIFILVDKTILGKCICRAQLSQSQKIHLSEYGQTYFLSWMHPPSASAEDRSGTRTSQLPSSIDIAFLVKCSRCSRCCDNPLFGRTLIIDDHGPTIEIRKGLD